MLENRVKIGGIAVLRREPWTGDDSYGHYWSELDNDLNGTPDESAGFWPKSHVNKGDAIAGKIDGEINGTTTFDGTPTTDPHQGERGPAIDEYDVYGSRTKSREYYSQSLRADADAVRSLNFKYQIPDRLNSENCQSFQKGWLRRNDLLIMRRK